MGMGRGAVFSCALLTGALVGAGCSLDWDRLDPRVNGGASSSGSAGAGGMGSGGQGGAGTSSTGGGSGEGGQGGGVGGSGNGGNGGTGGNGGSGGAPAPCGGTNLLSDTFDDGTPGIDWLWIAPSGGAVGEDMGVAHIQMSGGSPTATYAAMQSKRRYNLKNDLLSLEVQKTCADPKTRTFLVLYYDDTHYLEISKIGPDLKFTKRVGGSSADTVFSQTYDASKHRYWRFVEDGQQVFWQTSSDGQTWDGASWPSDQLFPLDLLRVDFGCLSEPAGNGDEARFDALNAGAPPKGLYCPGNTLKDDFNDAEPGALWARTYADPGCTLSEQGGELIATAAADSMGYCAYRSGAAYDLVAAPFVVEVPAITNTMTTGEVFLRAEIEELGSVEISQSMGKLRLMTQKVPGPKNPTDGPIYDPQKHRFWRLGETNGKVLWEASPDGKTWTALGGSVPTPISLAKVDISLGTGTYEIVPTPPSARFAGTNLSP